MTTMSNHGPSSSGYRALVPNGTAVPREDDELLTCIVAAGEQALDCARLATLEPALGPRETLEEVARCMREIGQAATEVTETLRNWATQVDWDALVERGSGSACRDTEATTRFVLSEFEPILRTVRELSSPSYLRRETDATEEFALDKNAYDYYRPAGSDLLARTQEYLDWVDARRKTETWQYSRTLESAPSSVSSLRNDVGRLARGINYNSQDYLSLNVHPQVRAAVIEAIAEFGPHSAGSPMALGNTRYSNDLECALGELTGLEHVTLFPTGWAAGFGSVVGLVRQDDHIVLDRLCHACLQQGARAATRNIVRYEHLSIESAIGALKGIRSRDTQNGILVVTDGLFSVDSDWPDIRKLQTACSEYGATLLVDVAHDLGTMGPGGTGVLGMQNMVGQVDLVMSSFSKVFASNGGFLASRSPAVKQYVKMFSGTHLFSNALSAPQAAAVLKACQIVRSPEGDALRMRLFAAISGLRDELTRRGLTCMGEPSPIVPLLVGNEKLARIAHRKVFERNVLALLVEFPISPTGASRFRLQVQADHTPEQGREAAKVFDEVLAESRAYLSSAFGMGLS